MLVRSANIEHRGIRITNGTVDANEHVTIDLHAGSSYYVPGNPTPLAFDKPIKIKHGQCIAIGTKETLQLPNNIFGVLCSKGKLSAGGIVVGNNKIDPLFDGSMNVPLYNAGSSTYTINEGQAFCCVAFHLIEAEIPSTETRHAIKPSPRCKVSFLDRSKPYLRYLLPLLMTAVGAAVGTGITILLMT